MQLKYQWLLVTTLSGRLCIALSRPVEWWLVCNEGGSPPISGYRESLSTLLQSVGVGLMVWRQVPYNRIRYATSIEYLESRTNLTLAMESVLVVLRTVMPCILVARPIVDDKNSLSCPKDSLEIVSGGCCYDLLSNLGFIDFVLP